MLRFELTSRNAIRPQVREIKEHIAWLEEKLKEIESQIKNALAATEDWKQKKQLLTSVPGVGEVVATTLISSLPELGQLSHKSLSYSVGLAPLNRDSGNTNSLNERYALDKCSL